MSTVKISDLPLSGLGSSSNTFFVVVDTSTYVTSRASETQLSQSLYNSNILNVGGGPLIFSNISGQFTGNSSPYLQLNGQNFNPSSSFDYVATADIGTNSYNYIDFGINNSTFSDSAYSSMSALDGYLYVQGSSSQTSGNLVIGTATSNTNIVFIAGGITSSNVVGRINSSKVDLYAPTSVAANSSLSAFTITQAGSGPSFIVNDSTGSDPTPFIIDTNGNIGIATTSTNSYKLNVVGDSQFTGNIVFSDNSIQNTAASPIAVTNAIAANLVAANTSLRANDGITLSAAKSYTDAANTYIKNNYLANTSGVTTAGDFNITGNTTTQGLSANGLINITAIPYSGNTASVKITGSLNNAIQNPLNPGYMLQITGYANTPTRIVTDSYGANTYSAYIGRAARGTANTPLSTVNGDILLRLSGNGFGNTSFSQYGVSRIDMVADENYTENSKGSRIEFWNTASGSNTLNKIATFNANTVSFSGVVNPQKGFIYNPRSFTTAQTAITVDFSSDSSIYVQFNTSLTISVANSIPGKVVEVWAKDIATNGRQTITHGVDANNSTVATLSFTVPNQSITHLKYISLGSDASNTFCSIIHP